MVDAIFYNANQWILFGLRMKKYVNFSLPKNKIKNGEMKKIHSWVTNHIILSGENSLSLS